MLNRSILFLLILLILALPSCKVDGEEEMVIHADGTTEISLNYLAPTIALTHSEGRKIISYLEGLHARHPSLEIISSSSKSAGFGRIRLMARIKFNSPLKVADIIEEETNRIASSDVFPSELTEKLLAVLGEVSLNINGLHVSYRRTIVMHKALSAQLPNRDLLGDFSYRYTLTTPEPVEKHNATRVSNHGRSLTWVMPLKTYYDKPFQMQAEIPIPLPWWTIPLLILVIILILFLLWKWKSRRGHKKMLQKKSCNVVEAE